MSMNRLRQWMESDPDPNLRDPGDFLYRLAGSRSMWREALRDLVDLAVILGLMVGCFVLLSAL